MPGLDFALLGVLCPSTKLGVLSLSKDDLSE